MTYESIWNRWLLAGVLFSLGFWTVLGLIVWWLT